jgi:membrane-associated phospholipid phosphatase
MKSIYEKCVGSYPQVLFFVLLILCHAYHISYAYAFIGYIGNSIVNGILKQTFRALIGDAGSRPVPHHSTGPFDDVIAAVWPEHMNNTAYGFPSGHAQSVGYFLAFAHQFLPWRSWHPAGTVAALVIAAFLMHTRIAFRRHTFVQVLFGFLFGIATFRAFHLLRHVDTGNFCFGGVVRV